MQVVNNYLTTNQSTASSFVSVKQLSGRWTSSSWVVSFNGDATAAGTVQLQMSNDPCLTGNTNSFLPVNWVNVPGTQATATVVAGAAVVVYPPVSFTSQWLRIQFTRTGGATTCSIAYDGLSL